MEIDEVSLCVFHHSLNNVRPFVRSHLLVSCVIVIQVVLSGVFDIHARVSDIELEHRWVGIITICKWIRVLVNRSFDLDLIVQAER